LREARKQGFIWNREQFVCFKKIYTFSVIKSDFPVILLPW
jgi:hypothetical protein